MKLAKEEMEAGDFPSALKAARAVSRPARTARRSDLVTQAAELVKEVSALDKEFKGVAEAELALSVNPEDPGANLALGRFLCHIRGDWDTGLPLLVKGGNAPLKAAAERELID